MIATLTIMSLAILAAMCAYRAGRHHQLAIDIPRMRTPCEELQSFADGELDPDRTAAVRQHLRGCQECRRELMSIVNFRAQLDELLAAPP